MKEIKEYIKLNMVGYPFWKIEEYIYSFLEDGEITEKQFDSLIKWAEDWYKVQ